MRRAAIVLALSVLAGCATTPASIPIPISCISALPVSPASEFDALPDSATLYDAVRALLIDRIAREQYRRELEAVIAGCR